MTIDVCLLEEMIEKKDEDTLFVLQACLQKHLIGPNKVQEYSKEIIKFDGRTASFLTMLEALYVDSTALPGSWNHMESNRIVINAIVEGAVITPFSYEFKFDKNEYPATGGNGTAVKYLMLQAITGEEGGELSRELITNSISDDSIYTEEMFAIAVHEKLYEVVKEEPGSKFLSDYRYYYKITEKGLQKAAANRLKGGVS